MNDQQIASAIPPTLIFNESIFTDPPHPHHPVIVPAVPDLSPTPFTAQLAPLPIFVPVYMVGNQIQFFLPHRSTVFKTPLKQYYKQTPEKTDYNPNPPVPHKLIFHIKATDTTTNTVFCKIDLNFTTVPLSSLVNHFLEIYKLRSCTAFYSQVEIHIPLHFLLTPLTNSLKPPKFLLNRILSGIYSIFLDYVEKLTTEHPEPHIKRKLLLLLSKHTCQQTLKEAYHDIFFKQVSQYSLPYAMYCKDYLGFPVVLYLILFADTPALYTILSATDPTFFLQRPFVKFHFPDVTLIQLIKRFTPLFYSLLHSQCKNKITH